MRFLKIGVAAMAVTCALSATAQADCIKVGAEGQNITHDLAVLFSTHALANIIYGQGREGGGQVHTTCDGPDGTTCHSWQVACKVSEPHPCLGAWLCF